MFRVKICGITTATDAAMAVSFGADAIGINFYRGSRRYVPPDEAAPIIAALRGKASAVGVFVNESPEVIEEICRTLGIGMVQLSGREPASLASRLPFRRIKAVHLGEESELRSLRDYPCESFLLDAYVPGEYGGTGVALPWDRIAALWEESDPPGGGGAGQRKPWILAGGLTPENVRTAIHLARPDGVDVASGVETLPGKKDPMKLKLFIKYAKKELEAESKI